jgi:hypothetical protein
MSLVIWNVTVANTDKCSDSNVNSRPYYTKKSTPKVSVPCQMKSTYKTYNTKFEQYCLAS